MECNKEKSTKAQSSKRDNDGKLRGYPIKKRVTNQLKKNKNTSTTTMTTTTTTMTKTATTTQEKEKNKRQKKR